MYKTRKDALASIQSHVRRVGDRDYTTFECYLGKNPITGKYVRLWDKDRARLEQTVKDFYYKLDHAGDLGALLTANQVMDAKAALDELAANGLSFTLLDCVKVVAEQERARAAVPTKPIGEAYDEYYETFGELQVKHKAAIRYRVGNWVDSIGRDRTVASVTAQEIVAWLDSRYSKSNKTWNNSMIYIKTFLAWCLNSLRRYTNANPLQDLKKKPIAWVEPTFVKPEVTAQLFALLKDNSLQHPDWLAYSILSFFCGVRREEIIRMASDPTAGSICLEDETARIAKGKGYQKGIRPRSFNIPANALAWMKSFDFAWGLRHVTPHTSERMAVAAKAAGIHLTANPGRHTFITMHVAAYGEPMKTEAICGTSASMRANNYMGLASKREGLAHFAITPESVSAPAPAPQPV